MAYLHPSISFRNASSFARSKPPRRSSTPCSRQSERHDLRAAKEDSSVRPFRFSFLGAGFGCPALVSGKGVQTKALCLVLVDPHCAAPVLVGWPCFVYSPMVRFGMEGCLGATVGRQEGFDLLFALLPESELVGGSPLGKRAISLRFRACPRFQLCVLTDRPQG